MSCALPTCFIVFSCAVATGDGVTYQSGGKNKEGGKTTVSEATNIGHGWSTSQRFVLLSNVSFGLFTLPDSYCYSEQVTIGVMACLHSRIRIPILIPIRNPL